ncbi:MAG: hypothetical protein FJ033_13155 [Chloroflexi bacterium]|nr:hypothetical protein [Chloroflexota bacterium]
MAQSFAEWLGVQMDRKGIRSGRRLSAETGFEEAAVLDWAIGRRVPTAEEVFQLARFFRIDATEGQALREKSEATLPRRSATRRAFV